MGAENRVEISELRRAVDAHDGDIVTGLDRFGRIVDQHWIDGMSTATDRFQYGYDENSNRLFRRNVVDATFSELYDYDDFNQLSDFARGTLSTTSDSIVGTPVRSQDWSPHPLGNASTISTSISGTPTPEERTYNAQNQFDTVGGNPLDYDANGNLIVDQNGNLYFYDAWNRLVKIEDSSNDLLTAYSYNPLNRRIIEDDGTTETHLFYSADWQVLEEQVSGDTTTQYVWSPIYIDAMILRDRDTDSDGYMDERLYVQQDANFNVTALADISGDVVQRFVQDPFGLVTDVLDDSWSPQSDAFDWKYLHQGLRFDAQVDKYDNRMRIYDPVLQRFIQVDPILFGSGDPNFYRYVNNNPIVLVDPTGDIWWFFFGGQQQGAAIEIVDTEFIGVGDKTLAALDQSRFAKGQDPLERAGKFYGEVRRERPVLRNAKEIGNPNKAFVLTGHYEKFQLREGADNRTAFLEIGFAIVIDFKGNLASIKLEESAFAEAYDAATKKWSKINDISYDRKVKMTKSLSE